MPDDPKPEPGVATSPSDPDAGAPETPTPTAVAETSPAEDWEGRFRYLLADFENFRRRTERDREAVSRQARGGILRELLPILEGFQSAHVAIAQLPADQPVRRGLELLDREWAKFLKQEGVEPVATVGQSFDAREAEAVGEVPASDGAPAGTVGEVVQQGYRYFGGLLRPAKVLVARSAAPAASPDAAEKETA